jgi:hypothetical protein
MDEGSGDTISRTSDRVLRLLESVEHRCAATRAEKEAAFRIRYEAFIRQGLVGPRTDGQLYDKIYDDAPNAWVTTTFIDGELAGTVRINVGADENGALPSLGVFSDVIAPHLRVGRMIVDPTRFAARLEFAKRFPEFPYIALRPAWLALEYFKADFGLISIVEEHQFFYRRAFGYAPWCEPRDYPGFNRKVVCMGLDFRAAKERVEARHPFLRSTSIERDALFGRQADRPSPLPTVPGERLRVPAE